MFLEIIGLTLAAAGIGLNAKGQSKSDKANKKAAADAFRQSHADLSARGVEERIAAISNQNAINRQAASAAALARVSAGEAGVTGTTAEEVEHDIEFDRGTALSNVGAGLTANLAQLDRAKRGEMSLMHSRMNATNGPSPWLTGLQLAGAGVDFASLLLNQKPTSGTK